MKDNQKKVTRADSFPSTPQVALDKIAFDNTIKSEGPRLYVDRALKCPCKTKGVNNHLSSCKNCGSTGWVFYNRTEISGIIYSMSWENSFKEWSEENLGNVFITVRDEHKVSFMDRVTVIDAETIHKQILYPFIKGDKAMMFTTYSVKSIIDIFLFVKDTAPLLRLIEGVDFTLGSSDSAVSCKISDNVIMLSDNIKKKIAACHGDDKVHLSVIYNHPPQYHITHLLRDSMVSIQLNGKPVRMPVSAVGRRSHYVLDAENFNGDRLLDNSYN